MSPCACGRPAVKRKDSSPVCARCLALENKGRFHSEYKNESSIQFKYIEPYNVGSPMTTRHGL